jgi:hypothetical protein
VGDIWGSLPGYDRENVDEWLSRVVPVVETGQRSSSALTDAFLARRMGRQPLGVAAIGAQTRNGTPPEEVYHRPFVTLWSKLGASIPFEDAASAALSRATGSAAMDMQLAMRSTAGQVNEADPAMYGFQRVADGGACEFCSLVDGAYVKDGDAMPLHNNCGCGLEPLDAPHPLAAKLPSGVAVHEHGELGAVLTAPGEHFTSESQI